MMPEPMTTVSSRAVPIHSAKIFWREERMSEGGGLGAARRSVAFWQNSQANGPVKH